VKIDVRVGYVEMDFEFKCDWKCESTVCFLIGVVIGKLTLQDMNSNSPTIVCDNSCSQFGSCGRFGSFGQFGSFGFGYVCSLGSLGSIGTYRIEHCT